MSQPGALPASELPPIAVLFDLITARWVSIAVLHAAKLGIADELESGPRTTSDLALRLNVHEGALYRLLRALTTQGIFHEAEGRTFSQTPISDLLRTNARPSLRNSAISLLDDYETKSWGEFGWTVQTGRPAIEKAFGMGLFEYLGKHPEESVRFNNNMTDLSMGDAPAVVASYDFSPFEHIVDIAGGIGFLLAAILNSSPKLRGTLFDMPAVIEQAKSAPILAPLSGRCEFVGGSFFESVPAADAYIMKHILHDWDYEHAVKILVNCRKALRPGGKLLVVDRVIGPPNQADGAKIFDLEMMVLPGGLERDETEWRALFAASGFKLDRIIPMPAPQSILEGTPA